MDVLGRKGREINREERESREREFNNQHIREGEMKGKVGREKGRGFAFTLPDGEVRGGARWRWAV